MSQTLSLTDMQNQLSQRSALEDRRERLTSQMRILQAKSNWTAEDRANWDAMEIDVKAFQADFKAMDERRGRIGRDGGDVEAGPLNPSLFTAGGAQALDNALNTWMLAQMGEAITAEQARACESYGAYPMAASFIARLPAHTPRVLNRWAVQNSLSTEGGTAGGYTVAEGFIPRLERAILDYASVLGVAEIMQTDTGIELPWPTSDDTNNEGVILGQNAESTDLDPEFGAMRFRAWKVSSRLVKVPFELLRDSGVTNFAGELGAMLGERLGRKMGRDLTTGNAAGTSQGIVTGATLGKTATSATAISFDDLIDLVASVDVGYQRAGQCGFMMSQLVAASVRKLKDGDGRYLWQDSTQLGQPPMLLGFPVSLNNYMATSITSGAKSVLFGLFSKFKVRLVGQVRMKRLVERYAEFDQEGFLGFREFDGGLLQPAAVKYLIH